MPAGKDFFSNIQDMDFATSVHFEDCSVTNLHESIFNS